MMRTGTNLIKEERMRQLTEEGFSPEDDLSYTNGELIDAAICYATAASMIDRGESFEIVKRDPTNFSSRPWPWHPSWWKPSEDANRNLVKSAALMAAEIDRSDNAAKRLAAKTQSFRRP